MGLLDGRVALITGAAAGVGLAVARRFAEEGAALMLTDRDEATLAGEAETIAQTGATVRTWSCDPRQKLSVANLMASAEDHFGGVDVLVNASLSPFHGEPLEADASLLDEAYANNLRAVFMLCQAVSRRMIAARREDPSQPAGAIVNLTSTAAQRTVAELWPYSVTCAALDQLTRSLAVALANDGVRVNGVSLGAVMTKSLAASLRETDGLRADLERATPMRRVGEANEAAEAVLFLASSRASFITGQILAVDGGRSVLDPLATPTE